MPHDALHDPEALAVDEPRGVAVEWNVVVLQGQGRTKEAHETVATLSGALGASLHAARDDLAARVATVVAVLFDEWASRAGGEREPAETSVAVIDAVVRRVQESTIPDAVPWKRFHAGGGDWVTLVRLPLDSVVGAWREEFLAAREAPRTDEVAATVDAIVRRVRSLSPDELSRVLSEAAPADSR